MWLINTDLLVNLTKIAAILICAVFVLKVLADWVNRLPWE